MMRKRLLAVGLALALCLPLTAVPAAAAPVTTFPDVQDHWAKTYITEMTQAGMFTGYEDGTFRPDNTLTASEALTLCARVATQTYGLDNNTIWEMTTEWRDDLMPLLGSSYSWFGDKAAIALETGILSWADLSQRVRAGALNSPLQKELFSVYLVRAMGLETLAQTLSVYTLDFADASNVTTSYAPYVYLLSSYGVLTGDEFKNFNPEQPVNRAISATMMSRVLNYINTTGLKPELPEYTDYEWQAGTISRVVTGDRGAVNLELTNSLSEPVLVTVPVTAEIYKNDRKAASKDLKTKMYARVCYGTNGRVAAVRLYDASLFNYVSGPLTDISPESVTIWNGTKDVTYTIDRFTEVSASGQSGDRTLIDDTAGYDSAVVCHNSAGTAISVALQGGAQLEDGLIQRVTSQTGGGYSLQVIGFDGVSRRYTVPSDADVTVNQLTGILRSTHEGCYAAIRVSEENPDRAVSVAVDTTSDYIQGSIKTRVYNKTPSTLTVTDLVTRKSTAYTVPDGAEIYYEGRRAELRDLSVSDFVTIKLSSKDEALLISAWPSTTETRGEVTGISYGATTVLTVLREDGTTVQFSLKMDYLPAIERDGVSCSVTKLNIGDRVTVTMRYQDITFISAVSQEANATGFIETVTHTANSSTLVMTLTDGITQTYTVSESASIILDGNPIARTALQPGSRLSMVVSGGTILSATVESTVSSSTKITGSILYIDFYSRTILFRLDNGSAITVRVSESATMTDAAGNPMALGNLNVGNGATIYGGYRGGEFDAALLIRE